MYVMVAVAVTAVALHQGVPVLKAAALTVGWAKVIVDYRKYRAEVDEAKEKERRKDEIELKEDEQGEEIERELQSLLTSVDAILQRIEALEALSLTQIHYGNRRQRTFTATEF